MTQNIKRIVQNQDFLTLLQQLAGAAVTGFQIRNSQKGIVVAESNKRRNRANIHTAADHYLRQFFFCLWYVVYSVSTVEPFQAFVNSGYSVNNAAPENTIYTSYISQALYHNVLQEAIRFMTIGATSQNNSVPEKRENGNKAYYDFSVNKIMSRILEDLVVGRPAKTLTRIEKPRGNFSNTRGTGKGIFSKQLTPG